MSQALRERNLTATSILQLVQGDLTQETVEAIVNAANAELQHGGGVARAIVRAGGASIQAESDAWVRAHGLVRPATPAYTRAGILPYRYVIHAVGPVWGEGDEDAKLGKAIQGSLRLADQLELRSIAFPAISTGIFGFPKERAARVTLAALRDYFKHNPASDLGLVRLTLFDQPTVQAFLQTWDSLDWEAEADQP